jgi:hypothetical protein
MSGGDSAYLLLTFSAIKITEMIKLFYENKAILQKKESILINLFFKMDSSVYGNIMICEVFLGELYFKATFVVVHQ